MIWWGAGLMALSALAVLVAIPLWFSGLGDTFTNLDRDVAVRGSAVADAPGRIDFDVLEPLDGPASMRVGIGVPFDAVSADCWFETAEGTELTGLRSNFDLFVNAQDYDVQVAAELEPGSYTAVCDQVVIADSSSVDPTFVVGRVLGDEFVDEIFTGFGRSFLVILVAGLAGIVGLVLLIVGLVRRSSARRPPMPPPGYGPPGAWGPPGGPPQQEWPPPPPGR